MRKGYMCVSREKVSEFEWLSNPNTFYVFMRLLFKANYKDSRWEGVEVKRGQLLTGRKALSSELNLTERQIRTCLERLTNTGYIVQQTTNKHTIITICEYDSWVNVAETNDQQNGKQTASNQPADDQQTTTSELKKEKEENKSKEEDRAKALDSFEVVWDLYKKKKGRNKTLIDKWRRLSDDERVAVMRFIPAYVALTEEAYRKQFVTFLNQRTWEDEKIYTCGVAVPVTAYREDVLGDGVLFSKTVARFNELVQYTRIPQVTELTEKRRVLFNVACCMYFQKMKTVMEKVVESSSLNGGGGLNWVATFDWIFTPENFKKIYDGAYDDVRG